MKKQPKNPSPATQEVLMAWDPVTQTEKWRVPIGDKEWSGGGVLTTAGNLVIQGTSAGHLVVYRADNGEKLHDIEVGTGIMAAPIAYEIDGEQYVAVLAGFGARVAGGCTSGLGLSGAAALGIAAFVFLALFFATGLITSRIVRGV